MNSWPFVLPVLASPVLALVTITSDCNGDGELTLGEYMHRVEALDKESEERSARFRDDLQETFDSAPTVEQSIDAYRDLLGASATVLEDNVNDLRHIDPPAQVKHAHSEYVDSLAAMAVLFEDFVARFEEVESASQLEEALAELQSPQFTQAGDRIDAASVALQGLADEGNIDVDLFGGTLMGFPLGPTVTESLDRPPVTLSVALAAIDRGNVAWINVRPDSYPDGDRRWYGQLESDGSLTSRWRVNGRDVLIDDIPILSADGQSVGLTEDEWTELLQRVSARNQIAAFKITVIDDMESFGTDRLPVEYTP